MNRLSAFLPTVRSLLIAALAAALTASTASADIVVSLQNVNAQVGSSGDAIEVDLTNTGPSSVSVGGFSFGLSVANANISFTSADISTVTPYIFAGHSLFGPVISTTPPPSGQVVEASDNYDIFNSGIVLASGGKVGLGRVLFDVSAGASAGTNSVVLTSFPATSLSDFQGNDVPITTLQNGSITLLTSSVPEPSTVTLLGLGMVLATARFAFKRRCRSPLTTR